MARPVGSVAIERMDAVLRPDQGVVVQRGGMPVRLEDRSSCQQILVRFKKKLFSELAETKIGFTAF